MTEEKQGSQIDTQRGRNVEEVKGKEGEEERASEWGDEKWGRDKRTKLHVAWEREEQESFPSLASYQRTDLLGQKTCGSHLLVTA